MTTVSSSPQTIRFLVTALALVACLSTGPALGQDRLSRLLGNGGAMLHSPSGESLLNVNSELELVPASIVKIPLAQVALTTLGEGYRFETHFYRNGSGDLLIRGFGDPFLVSEEIAHIANQLAARGLGKVERLVMDDSAFAPNLDLPREQDSSQPYAAQNSALAVNFNTVNLAWTEQGTLISGEAQTPLTALARELATGLPSGGEHRISFGEDPNVGLRQAQQVFHFFLNEAGVEVSDANYFREEISDDWTLFYAHKSSRSLRDNIDGMLRYSNNFIANQLFLTLAAQRSGYPASAEGARTVLRERLTELYGEGYGRDPQKLLMLEGSGLSRTQRTTAAGMLHILEVFKPYSDLLPEVNGVLRKSGTLTGVYNFAGYVRRDAQLYPFVVLTNQTSNNRAEVLRELQRNL